MVSETIEAWKSQRDQLHHASEMLADAREDYNASIAGIREKLSKIEMGIANEIELQASQMTEKGNPLSNAQKREAEKQRRLEESRIYQDTKKEEEVLTMTFIARERKISLDVKKHRDNAEFYKMCFWDSFADRMSAERVD